MKHIKIFLLSLASSIGAFAVDLNTTPGQLESLLDDATKNQTELKLKGAIDARDLAALENLPSGIRTLDLSGVSVNELVMSTRKYFGKTLFREGEIPAYTFFKTSVTSLILPSKTVSIGEGAFASSDIAEITIPEGVTSIGDYAFYGCTGLKSVKLPSSLTSIGKGAFGNCMALKSIDLSSTKITEVPERAFAGAMELESVKLPQSVSKVGREAFSHTAIQTLSLNNVAEFEAYALSSMPFLSSLAINPNASIGDGLLMDDISLASLTGLPEFVPAYFAANCSNFDASEVKNTASLGNYSFANTLSPENLVLSPTLAEISRGALSGLVNLKQIDATSLQDRLPHADQYSFEGLNPAEITLLVDQDYADVWKSDPVWSTFNIVASEPTGIDDIITPADSGISIRLTGGIINISSGTDITDVRIYTPDGRIAYVASPGTPVVDVETAALPSGLVVVTASDADGNSSTLSLLLK